MIVYIHIYIHMPGVRERDEALDAALSTSESQTAIIGDGKLSNTNIDPKFVSACCPGSLASHRRYKLSLVPLNMYIYKHTHVGCEDIG